jgi:2-hydroxychromene-2-carboxylate isomerase
LWLKKQSDSLARRYIDLVFERYFNDTLDIEADTALQALVEEIVGEIGEEIGEEIGADLDGLADCFGADALSAVTTLHAQLAEAGIFNVPGFVVEGEIYNGREHLPMIRWILTGRNGPGPI